MCVTLMCAGAVRLGAQCAPHRRGGRARGAAAAQVSDAAGGVRRRVQPQLLRRAAEGHPLSRLHPARRTHPRPHPFPGAYVHALRLAAVAPQGHQVLSFVPLSVLSSPSCFFFLIH